MPSTLEVSKECFTNEPYTINRVLRLLREQWGMTIPEFAPLFGQTPEWWSQLELSKLPADSSTQAALAVFLPIVAVVTEVDVTWLMMLPIDETTGTSLPVVGLSGVRFDSPETEGALP